VVLDNCEHLVEAAAALAEALVPYCPSLRMLATSRTRLGVAGETVWTVAPLDVPDPNGVERVNDLAGYAATRLFLDRAGAARVAIGDRTDSARAVAVICAAVDGLPLGIELAAALARELPLSHVASGLVSRRAPATADRLAGRHRSLDAAIGWGYDLLDPTAQRLVRRLAVFEGGWTIEAADAVCAGDDHGGGHIATVLAGLVAASFVTYTPATERYAMSETVHAFARVRLAEASETEAAHNAHLAWCCQFAAEAAPGLAGPDAGVHVRRLDAEHPNLRTALRWALTDDRLFGDAERLAHDLINYWAIIDGALEAVGWIRQILDRPGPLTAERIELTIAVSHYLSHMGDISGSGDYCEDALGMARCLGDPHLVCRCLMIAAFFCAVDEKMGLAVEAQSIAKTLGDAGLAAGALHMQGLLAARAGRGDEAVALYQKSLATGYDPSDMLLGTRYRLALVLVAQGRWEAAHDELLTEELEKGAAGMRGHAGQACVLLCHVELAQNNLDGARRAFERANVWGRPSADYEAHQMVFDATAALLDAAGGNVAAGVDTARRLAQIPPDISGRGEVCLAWSLAAEVLARAGDMGGARRCFANILGHRAGRFPRERALGLAGVAGTLAGQPDIAANLGAAAYAIFVRHGFVSPPWLTTARIDSAMTALPSLPEDDAVALALTFDDF
jgi:predicted ATPase